MANNSNNSYWNYGSARVALGAQLGKIIKGKGNKKRVMAGKKQKCYINYLGCEKRKLDAQRVVNYLRANGYGLTGRSADADVIVFLTCAFCNKYENYSVAKLSKIYAQKQSGAMFIVGGCLPAINPERLATFPEAIQIQARELDSLDSILHARVPMQAIPDPNTTIFDKKDEALPRTTKFKSPAQCEYEAAKRGYKIRIDWGCLGNCAYCVTRLAEGQLTSKSLDQVLKEFRQGLDEGVTSFFFTGGDTGAYGIDCGLSIVSLLDRILAIRGDYVIHFHDFGIQWLIRYYDELLLLFRVNPEKLGCFCFPVQSGSNKILKLMRRPYSAEAINAILIELKQSLPKIKIGTHFVVGFPGETEDDFAQSSQMLQDIPFDFVEVYRYKDHSRADSHAYSNKVPQNVICERNAILDQIFAEKHF